jgi:hypothetical protein
MPFRQGDTVVLREVWHGRVWKARPAIVVRDDEQLALWTPHGALLRIGDNGPVPPRAGDDWRHVDYVQDLSALRLVGDHTHFVLWDGSGFAGWSVNLESPFERTNAGFDFQDFALDLRIHPDGRIEVQDEDELAEMERRGLVDGDWVRAEAARIIARPPVPSGWEDWRPDPSWPVPSLPAGWDEL